MYAKFVRHVMDGEDVVLADGGAAEVAAREHEIFEGVRFRYRKHRGPNVGTIVDRVKLALPGGVGFANVLPYDTSMNSPERPDFEVIHLVVCGADGKPVADVLAPNYQLYIMSDAGKTIDSMCCLVAAPSCSTCAEDLAAGTPVDCAGCPRDGDGADLVKTHEGAAIANHVEDPNDGDGGRVFLAELGRRAGEVKPEVTRESAGKCLCGERLPVAEEAGPREAECTCGRRWRARRAPTSSGWCWVLESEAPPTHCDCGKELPRLDSTAGGYGGQQHQCVCSAVWWFGSGGPGTVGRRWWRFHKGMDRRGLTDIVADAAEEAQRRRRAGPRSSRTARGPARADHQRLGLPQPPLPRRTNGRGGVERAPAQHPGRGGAGVAPRTKS